ncbi:MAG: uL22 family ribosomal protein [Candidatus Micrarchaeota archaeon]|mgnify:CR=1 FL=1
MSRFGYAIDYDATKTARAQVYDLDASYKDMTQVCAAMRGKSADAAAETLQAAINLEKPIRFYSHAKGLGHRSQLGGKQGKFPKKECKLALSLLKNAIAAAADKGIDAKGLMVLHAQAYKQNSYPRYRRTFASSHTLGYGKQAILSRYVTARVEITVGEKGAKRIARKTARQVTAGLKADREARRKKPEGKEEKPEAPKELPKNDDKVKETGKD